MDIFDQVIQDVYNLSKGYDLHEIEKCIISFEAYLYDTIWYDVDTNTGYTADEIDTLIADFREYLTESLSGVSCHVTHIPCDRQLELINCYKGHSQQRTDEWFQKRRSMITASIIYYVLKINLNTGKGISVIRDKIVNTPHTTTENVVPSNPDAPSIRGIRYEPIIRQVYEKAHGVTVEEFDCIAHPAHPFLGASPDGIVTKGPTRGRMIEIKCPQPDTLLRDRDHIRPEYWAQMQLQMEVCDLEYCDYVRACVRDSASFDEMKAMHDTYSKDNQVITAGTIWMDYTGEYHSSDDTTVFIHEVFIQQAAFVRHYVILKKDWFEITVSRNRDWFENVCLPKAKEIWEEIKRGQEDVEAWQEQYPSRAQKHRDKMSVPFFVD